MVNPDPTRDAQPGKDSRDADGMSRFQERVRRAAFWCLQYWRELLNFRFDKYMIVQVLPGVYGILLTALILVILAAIVHAFRQNFWYGLGFLILPAPLTFLVVASILRALLEFYLVVFRISEHVDELVGLRDTVDRLSGISDTVDEMVSVTRRIPFWKAMSRRTERRNDRRVVPDHPRRRRTDNPDNDQER